MRRSSLALLPLAACAWIACGGGYGTDTSAPTEAGAPLAGERGGSCYPNSTCNADLTCVDSLCVRLDTDAGGGSTSDGGPGGDSAAPVTCVAPQPPLAAGKLQCQRADPCATPERCCPINADLDWKCVAEADCKKPAVTCDTNSDCPGSERCCFSLVPRASGTTCPSWSLLTSMCAAACPPRPSACEDSGDCAEGRTCITTLVGLGSSDQTIVIKACL